MGRKGSKLALKIHKFHDRGARLKLSKNSTKKRQQERSKPCVFKYVISGDIKYLTSKLRRFKVNGTFRIGKITLSVL